MKNLKNQIKLIQDLKRQHEIVMFRYYTGDSQSILLKLIADEVDKLQDSEIIPEDLYISLSKTESLALENIKELCLLYRKVILLVHDVENN